MFNAIQAIQRLTQHNRINRAQAIRAALQYRPAPRARYWHTIIVTPNGNGYDITKGAQRPEAEHKHLHIPADRFQSYVNGLLTNGFQSEHIDDITGANTFVLRRLP